MSIRTYEVKLDTAGNGVIQINVEAEDFEATSDGVTFFRDPDGDRIEVAYYPVAPLLGVKDVTP